MPKSVAPLFLVGPLARFRPFPLSNSNFVCSSRRGGQVGARSLDDDDDDDEEEEEEDELI